MLHRSAQPSIPAQLRVSAEERIKCGNAPATHGWPTGAQALSLLHALASTPGSASDVLKLLHELQVHQVELDLQQEQADQERMQLVQSQASYVALFDLAPFAYLALNPQGQVLHANRMACAYLGSAVHAAGTDRHVYDFLTLDDRQPVGDALLRLRQGSASESFVAHAHADGGLLQVRATAVPDAQLVLMGFMPLAPASSS